MAAAEPWKRIACSAPMSDGWRTEIAEAEFFALAEWWRCGAATAKARDGEWPIPLASLHMLRVASDPKRRKAELAAADFAWCSRGGGSACAAVLLYEISERRLAADGKWVRSEVRVHGCVPPSALLRRDSDPVLAARRCFTSVIGDEHRAAARSVDEMILFDATDPHEDDKAEVSVKALEAAFREQLPLFVSYAFDLAAALEDEEKAYSLSVQAYASRIDLGTALGRRVDLCNRRWLLYWASCEPRESRMRCVPEAVVRHLVRAKLPREWQLLRHLPKLVACGFQLVPMRLPDVPPEDGPAEIAAALDPPPPGSSVRPSEAVAEALAEARAQDREVPTGPPFPYEAILRASLAARQLGRDRRPWAAPAQLTFVAAEFPIAGAHRPPAAQVVTDGLDGARACVFASTEAAGYLGAAATWILRNFRPDEVTDPGTISEMNKALELFGAEHARRYPKPQAAPRARQPAAPPACVREWQPRRHAGTAKRKGGGASLSEIAEATEAVEARGLRGYVESLLGPPEKVYSNGDVLRWAGDRFSVTVGGQYAGSWMDHKYDHRRYRTGGPWALTKLCLYLAARGQTVVDDIGAAYEVVGTEKREGSQGRGPWIKQLYAYDRGPESPEPRDALARMRAYVEGKPAPVRSGICPPAPARKRARSAPPESGPGEDVLAEIMGHSRMTWDASVPVGPDNEAGKYLTEVRGLGALGWEYLSAHPCVRHHPALRCESLEDGRKELRPCLVVFNTTAEGRCYSGQAVFLEPGTGKKARGIKTVKKSWGSWAATNSFFLWQPGDLSVVDAVFLAEGAETAGSIACADPRLRVYAAGGLSNLGRFARDLRVKRADSPDGRSHPALVLCADEDRWAMPWPRPAEALENTTRLLERQVERLRAAGWSVIVVKPRGLVKDFNDELRSYGIRHLRETLGLPAVSRPGDDDPFSPSDPSRRLPWPPRTLLFSSLPALDEAGEQKKIKPKS